MHSGFHSKAWDLIDRAMLNFIVRRLLAILPVLLAVSLLTFLIASLLPGDLAYVTLGDQATPENARMRRALELPEETPSRAG